MVTANAIDNARSQYLLEGFHDYLSKPVEPAELEKLLKKFFLKFFAERRWIYFFFGFACEAGAKKVKFNVAVAIFSH